MKKLLAVLLSIVMIIGATLSFTSCGETDNSGDWAEIKERGYFVCGITVYAPMNYFNEDGDLVGFDTEFAEAVADYLGVEAKFQVIKWGSKYLELNSGSIDLIWNGFTYGAEDGVPRTNYVDFTHAYLKNQQCVVIRSEDAATLNAKAAFAGREAAVEGGSAGESVAKGLAGNEDKLAKFDSQAAALTELSAGQVDFAVIDLQMAKAMVGTGDYAGLTICTASDIVIEPEVYAIGARKGSDFTAKVNEAIEALYEDGVLQEIAKKYGLEYDLVEDFGK